MALPPTSPRLPSPPPPAEIQIGPKSPAGSRASLAQRQMDQQLEQTVLDANSKRRIHPGTRASDFAVGPPLVPLNEFQEHLAALHYFHTAHNTRPITRETARLLAQAPVGTDRTLWLYELCRFLIAQCNNLIVGFLFDTPPCSAVTCPEMRASEWQFLCAVHEQPKSCCAIDYCCHTLDWAANVVTNPKLFPSRFVFSDPHDKNSAVKNLINVFRRLHRIFAHAWFQHRTVFWSVEGQTGLYVLFKTVSDMYELLSTENYKLPPEAEGLETTTTTAPSSLAPAAASGSNTAVSGTAGHAQPAAENTPGLISLAALSSDRKAMGYCSSPGPILMSAMGRHGTGQQAHGNSNGNSSSNGVDATADDDHVQSVGRSSTRRHIRSSPSTGSAVTTVMEQDEDSASATLTGAPSASSSALFSQSKSNTSPSLVSAADTATSAATPLSALTPAGHALGMPSISVREHVFEGDDGDAAAGEPDEPEVTEIPVIAHSDIAVSAGELETAGDAFPHAADNADGWLVPQPQASPEAAAGSSLAETNNADELAEITSAEANLAADNSESAMPPAAAIWDNKKDIEEPAAGAEGTTVGHETLSGVNSSSSESTQEDDDGKAAVDVGNKGGK